MADFDLPHLEHSPASHDAEAVAPGSTQRDAELVHQAIKRYGAPSGPWLDIACGTGRHARALAEHNSAGVVAVDIDPRMIAAAQAADPANARSYQVADASQSALGGPFAAAWLLNRSLLCFHSHRQGLGLFRTVAQHLIPGGLLIMDNCCTAIWREIAAGNYADGLSVDGEQQLFFLPGDNRFVWRRGSEVDSDCWHPRDTDRVFRCWSMAEVALAAAAANLTLVVLASDSPLIVLQLPATSGVGDEDQCDHRS